MTHLSPTEVENNQEDSTARIVRMCRNIEKMSNESESFEREVATLRGRLESIRHILSTTTGSETASQLRRLASSNDQDHNGEGTSNNQIRISGESQGRLTGTTKYAEHFGSLIRGMDEMRAMADNAEKRRYNFHSLRSTGKVAFMMHKTVGGCGYDRACSLIPDNSGSIYMVPFEREPAIGAVFGIDASQLDAWHHGDIAWCMMFYNEDFGIIAADSLVERRAKLRMWLTVG